MGRKISIGIDQSYKNCGVSVFIDGEKDLITSIGLDKVGNNTQKRDYLRHKLEEILLKYIGLGSITVIIERIRLKSQRFISLDYIKSTAMLTAVIIDLFKHKGINTYSVDTRCWKAAVVGTSKTEKGKWGVSDARKWLTVKWALKNGYFDDIVIKQDKEKKDTFKIGNNIYKIDTDRADSAAIALFYFRGDRNKLKLEE